MKLVYLDTSALVKRYYRELGTKIVQELIINSSIIVVSKIAYAEIISALMRKRREGMLSMDDYQRVLAGFKNDWSNFYVVIELTDDIINRTEGLIENYPLRGFDAIHLASALVFQDELNMDLTFICSDNRLLEAARRENLQIVNPLK